jgi:hypothetical protein
MKKLQKFKNDKTDLICDNPACQTLIKVGEWTVVQYKIKYLGGNRYYHEKCVPR